MFLLKAQKLIPYLFINYINFKINILFIIKIDFLFKYNNY